MVPPVNMCWAESTGDAGRHRRSPVWCSVQNHRRKRSWVIAERMGEWMGLAAPIGLRSAAAYAGAGGWAEPTTPDAEPMLTARKTTTITIGALMSV